MSGQTSSMICQRLDTYDGLYPCYLNRQPALMNYTTFVWRSIVKGMSHNFIWPRHSPYSSTLWSAQAEEQQVPFLKSLVWPRLETENSPSRSGCANNWAKSAGCYGLLNIQIYITSALKFNEGYKSTGSYPFITAD